MKFLQYIKGNLGAVNELQVYYVVQFEITTLALTKAFLT